MMAMMPAFATDAAADLTATDTVGVERLRGADRMVRDGADASLPLARSAMPRSLPVSSPRSREMRRRSGARRCSSASPPSARETVAKCAWCDTAADGVLLAYVLFPSTVDSAVRFFREGLPAVPQLAILVYNPALHRHAAGRGVRALTKIPQIVGMRTAIATRRPSCACRRSSAARSA